MELGRTRSCPFPNLLSPAVSDLSKTAAELSSCRELSRMVAKLSRTDTGTFWRQKHACYPGTILLAVRVGSARRGEGRCYYSFICFLKLPSSPANVHLLHIQAVPRRAAPDSETTRTHLHTIPIVAAFSFVLAAPHSLHLLGRRPCSQIWDPPHSLHLLRIRPWLHIPAPTHSLHCARIRSCSQIWDPPHSLHCDLRRPCSHPPGFLTFTLCS